MPKKKSTSSDLPSQISIGILVGVLFVPMVQRLLASISTVGGNVYTYLSNSIYSNAAIGDRIFELPFILKEILTWTIAFIIASLAVVIMSIARKRPIKIPNFPQIFKLALFTWEGSFFDKLLTVILWVSTSFIVVSYLFFAQLSWSSLQMNATFDQRMAILAPLMTSEEIDLYRSEWAQMKNRNDYLRIMETLEEKARNSQIEISKRLWK